MTKVNALMIGGSAGSLEVLLKVLPGLKPDLSFAIIIILHRKTGMDELLTNLLAFRTAIPVIELEEKQEIRAGIIYIAPSDYHLLIEKDRTFSLDRSEKVNYSRPSIDLAFESAAEIFKTALAGLLLSGANADGVAGLMCIQKRGGRVMIQDPASASVPYMPAKAEEMMNVDAKLRVEEMADYINQL